MLNDTIECIQEEPIDDVSDDDNSDFSEKLLSVPRELSISDKIEVFWPIPTIYYPRIVSKYETTGKHDINFDNDER